MSALLLTTPTYFTAKYVMRYVRELGFLANQEKFKGSIFLG